MLDNDKDRSLISTKYSTVQTLIQRLEMIMSPLCIYTCTFICILGQKPMILIKR